MRKVTIALCLSIAAALHAAEPVEPERALIVTLKWEADTVTVDTVDRKEAPIPVQRGFGQLMPLFFELRSDDGDVYYSGGIKDPLIMPHSPKRLSSATSRLVLPDLPEARKLVIMKRISKDPDTGRALVMEATL